jgi:N-methylhydantoinase B/oxoprolinase/acetone carboxylase alpha subunit
MVPARNVKGKYIMNYMTLNEMKDDLKARIASLKQARQEIKTLRNDIKRETQVNKVVKQVQRSAKKADREAKRAARIAKLEARLERMKSPKALRKASQKASPVVSYTAEQIAEMNAVVA